MPCSPCHAAGGPDAPARGWRPYGTRWRRHRASRIQGPNGRVLDHQVHVDRQVGDLADALDDGLAKGEVRHEVVVHHVDMHEVGVGDGLEVAFEVAEISGKDAGCDLYAHGSHSMVEERRDGLRLHDVLVCVLWYWVFYDLVRYPDSDGCGRSVLMDLALGGFGGSLRLRGLGHLAGFRGGSSSSWR